MNAKDLRIVFMGTPDFAAASLKKLIEDNFDIAAVFEQLQDEKTPIFVTGKSLKNKAFSGLIKGEVY